MAIDVAALRKFQEMWGPVLQTVPAVIEAVARQGDLDRAVKEAQAKLAGAQAEIDAAYAEADKRLEAVNEAMDLVRAQRDDMLDKIQKADVKAKADIMQMYSDAQKELDSYGSKIAKAVAEFNGVEKRLAERLAEADAVYSAKIEQMESEVRALEKRRDSAERSLATLRDKLVV